MLSPAEQRQTLLRLCSGNESAVELIERVWEFCCLYDDIIDRDKLPPEEAVHFLVDWALFRLPASRFYAEHPELESAFRTAIAQWRAANHMERSGDQDQLNQSFVLRCSPYGFFTAVVLAASGPQAAAEAALYFYSQKTGDTLAAYLAEHGKG